MDTVLVTGASSGIGEALAKKFAHEGYNLVLVARSEDKLNHLAQQLEGQHQIKVSVQAVDISIDGAAEQLLSTLNQLNIEVDILVNCAGILEHGHFVNIPAHAQKQLIKTNICGLTDMLTHFLPAMIDRGKGRILNVASMSAFQPIPSLATYAASKAYVLSLSESLAEELVGTGVSVTALCPGVTETNMLVAVEEQISNGVKVPSIVIGNVTAVAGAGYRACLNGDAICVPGTGNLATTLMIRATPKWLMRRFFGIVGRYTLKES